MAQQTFTASQVLTAAQMNTLQANDYNQTVSTKTANYVLVAADKGTTVVMNSATATTITVNTSLFAAGDTLRIQNINTGATVVTAGTATVTTAGSLSVPQWGSGILYFTSASAAVYFPSATNSGLALITAQTIGSAVSSVAVTGAFSSTYENYLVTVSGGVASAAGALRIVMGSTTTGYYSALVSTAYSGGASTGYGSNNAANWPYAGYGNTNSLNLNMSIQAPQLAKNTYYVSTYTNPDGGGGGNTSGYLGNSTQYTDFTLSPTSGTLTGGTIRVYGYQNS
jgi:hypothetical protein